MTPHFSTPQNDLKWLEDESTDKTFNYEIAKIESKEIGTKFWKNPKDGESRD